MLLALAALTVSGCTNPGEEEVTGPFHRGSDSGETSTEANASTYVQTPTRYGVFLSLSGRDAVTASEGYETAVIDAQYLSQDEIAEMHARGQQVYSYINLGSLEDFRPYFETYQHLALKTYENWEEEYWMDLTSSEWQEFIGVTMANQLLEKGIDGFWVDNVDVYYQLPTEEIYAGVEAVLKQLMSYGKPVIINGGDEFVQLYLERNGNLDGVLTGVNQESVFSTINFDDRTLSKQTATESEYYLDYVNSVQQAGKDVFLLEYTTSEELINTIQNYVKDKGWSYYISNSIELDGD